MILRHPIPESDRALAAALYWDAFGEKLRRIYGPDDTALKFVASVLDPAHGYGLYLENGLIGIAGFRTARGALVDGTLADRRAVYGRMGGLWRHVLLGLLDTDTDNDRFLVDGICVKAGHRGAGAGTMLLHALCDEARQQGYASIRLDVADTNPRARALYLREGFRAVATSRLGLVRHVFGFSAATAMVKPL